MGSPTPGTVEYAGNGTLSIARIRAMTDHPGPLRHPKPLTPSDLHSMLEKEQEAIVGPPPCRIHLLRIQVNRLTRELTALRQQTASVASTTSSTSTTFNESGDPQHTPPYLSSATHPIPSNRHRSSSSISSYIPAVQGSRTRSVSGVAPPRDSSIPARPSADLTRSTRSREPSVTSPHQSEAQFSHRASLSRPSSMSVSRFEETAHHRGELDSIKRENEILRQRVRDLENTLKKYHDESRQVGEDTCDGGYQ